MPGLVPEKTVGKLDDFAMAIAFSSLFLFTLGVWFGSCMSLQNLLGGKFATRSKSPLHGRFAFCLGEFVMKKIALLASVAGLSGILSGFGSAPVMATASLCDGISGNLVP